MTQCMEVAGIANRLRQVLQSTCLSFDLTGEVLYGSIVRGKAILDSDIDLLAVGGGLPVERQRRSREIVQIKRLFPGLPLDILLMTTEEVRSKFENHNPLFLDIAEDGIVLLDRDGSLSKTMDATRSYVRDRGIERLDGGWRFPVERGTHTFLSQVSNLDFSRAMLEDAGRDHRIGQRLLEDAFYDKAVYHFQQAVEKSIKSMLIAMGVFRRTHIVGSVLRSICEEDRAPREWRDLLLQAANHSEELEPDVNLSRYPGIIDDAL